MAARTKAESEDAANTQEPSAANTNSPHEGDDMEVDEETSNKDEIKNESPDKVKEDVEDEAEEKEASPKEKEDHEKEGDKQEGDEKEGDKNEEDQGNEGDEVDEDNENGEGNEGDDGDEQSANNGGDIDPIYDQTLMKPIFERRDKSLKELLEAMDEFSPIIPDAVTNYYLTRAGFKTSDVRIKRLLALATQKFVADIANDAYQFSRIRAQTGNAAGAAARGRVPGSSSGRTVLTMESLSGVLEDYGVNAKRPDFFR